MSGSVNKSAIWLITICLTLSGSSVFAQTNRIDALRTVQKRILAHVDHMRAVTVAVRIGTNQASGVIIDNGFVITAAHAVDRTGQAATVILIDETTRTARVHGIDRGADVALLKLDDSKGLQTATLNTTGLPTGSTPNYVVAVGNPGGFQPHRAALLRFGIAAEELMIQSTCHIARGDSGGPLFNLDGHLVGIHRQILKASDANFHIPSTVIVANMRRLRKGETFTSAKYPTKVLALKVPPTPIMPRTACVDVWCDGKPVCKGTVLEREHGRIVTKASELFGKVTVRQGTQRADAKGWNAAIDLNNDTVILQTDSNWPVEISNGPKVKVGQLVLSVLPDGRTRVSIVGAAARTIDRQAGELGIVLDHHLTIDDVQPNGAAKKAGVLKGDVITGLAGEQIKNQSDLGRLLARRNAGDWLGLEVRRETKLVRLKLQLRHPANRRFNNNTFQLGAGGISSMRRTGLRNVIQHDAALSPGDCGGPVLNLDGQCVGLNIARAGREAVYMLQPPKSGL